MGKAWAFQVTSQVKSSEKSSSQVQSCHPSLEPLRSQVRLNIKIRSCDILVVHELKWWCYWRSSLMSTAPIVFARFSQFFHWKLNIVAAKSSPRDAIFLLENDLVPKRFQSQVKPSHLWLKSKNDLTCLSLMPSGLISNVFTNRHR